ncbi:unnamed protein product, partial [Bubo scandiacus]
LKIQCYLVGSQTYWHKGRRGPYQIAEVPQMCWINALPGLIPPGEKPAWIALQKYIEKKKKKKTKKEREKKKKEKRRFFATKFLTSRKLRGGRKKKKTKKRKRKKKKQRGKKNKKKKRKRERSLENTKNQPKFLNIFRLSWNSDQEMD